MHPTHSTFVKLVALLVMLVGALQARAELDEQFSNTAAGIRLRPPAGGEMKLGSTGSDEVVRFFNTDDKWLLVVTRLMLEEPTPLAEREQIGDDATTRGGLVGLAASQMPNDTPGKMLRLDFVPIAGHEGAVLASHFHAVNESRLQQQAIIRRSDRLYYLLTFTTPVTDVGRLEADEGARRAIEIFQSVIDSVELIDQEAIRQDQDARLFRTRQLFINWTRDRITDALVPERYYRIQKNGKDVGYTYVIEETADSVPNAGVVPPASDPSKARGVRIGVRSRMFPEAGRQVDSESWMWFSFDRREEEFSNLLVTQNNDDKTNYAQERGKSVKRQREVPVVVKNEIGRDEIISRKQDEYELNVWSIGKHQSLPPLKVQLPPYYIPQAVAHLLPRLVPLKTPDTYLFAVYSTDRRAVMLRYIDVEPVREVTLGGKKIIAVPVVDRTGLEGEKTIHYMSLDGQYLGSTSPDGKIALLPTDADTIMKVWKDANLSRPSDVNESDDNSK